MSTLITPTDSDSFHGSTISCQAFEGLKQLFDLDLAKTFSCVRHIYT